MEINKNLLREYKYFLLPLIMILFFLVYLSNDINQFLAVNFGILTLIVLISEYRKWLLLIVLTALLSVTSAYSPQIRLFIQLSSFCIVIILYTIDYFSEDLTKFRVPKDILTFIIIFLVVMVLTAILSKYPAVGFNQLLRQSAFFMLIYFIFKLVNSFEAIRIVTSSFYLIAILYLLFLLNLFINAGFDLFQINLEFVHGGENYINKNQYGGFFIIIISLVISFALKTEIKLNRVGLFFISLIFLTALFITNSRGAIISALASLLFILFQLNKRWFVILISSVTLVFLLIIFAPSDSFIAHYLRLEKVFSGRDYILQTTFNIIQNHYLFGTGPGGTKYEIYNNLPFMLGSLEELWMRKHYEMIELGHAHNFYLFFFSDMGILGFSLSIVLPFIFFRRSLRLIKMLKLNKGEFYYLTIGLTATGLGFFVRGIFEWGGILSYGTIFLDLPFWLIYILIVFISENIEQITAPNKGVV